MLKVFLDTINIKKTNSDRKTDDDKKIVKLSKVSISRTLFLANKGINF